MYETVKTAVGNSFWIQKQTKKNSQKFLERSRILCPLWAVCTLKTGSHCNEKNGASTSPHTPHRPAARTRVPCDAD
jgi:hypothetical protein